MAVITMSLRMHYVIVFTSLVVSSFGQNYVPVITDYSALNNKYLSESLPKDFYIGTISAYDPDGTQVSYAIEGNGGEYFSIGSSTGNVTLKKLLDFETAIEIKMKIKVTDGTGQTTSVDGKVFVLDENDNAPYFNDTAISRFLREDLKVGIIVAPIIVNDLDTNNRVLTVTCLRSTPSLNDSCNTFGLAMTLNSNKFWNGNLTLLKSLDYETRISYAIQLQAFDGLFYVTNEVHIEVIDVNDTPPRWVTAEPKTIDEELPNGTFVQYVSAVDGDITNQHAIYYELFGSNTDTFGITENGTVFVNKRIDFDDPGYQKGVPYDLNIRAREILNSNPLTLGNSSSDSITTSIKISVVDINDNAPTFSESSYVAYIDENIINGANVPGLQMTVTDIDSASYNSFHLFILNYSDIFGILPEDDSGSSSASLYIKNRQSIDYEKGVRTYIIQVQANETKVSNPHTGSTTVSIHVRDINDVKPSFDSPAYNGMVSETAQPGTFVIKIKATDEEEGDFGTAGIIYALYGNIPPHFSINPTSGDVTVANCSLPNSPGKSPCIDYEKKKEYILTVSATDAKGNASIALTSSVPLTIRILDENDNFPALETSYIGYIYEGETVTINPLIVNASDPDTVGGPVTYYINGDSTNLWLSPQLTDSTNHKYTNLTASRPIYYPDAPDQINGAFQFTIVAQDLKYNQLSLVTIYVIDINNNAPLFVQSVYRAQIYENIKGENSVIKVSAWDGDSYTTGNGQIDFYIQSGSLGKFTVHNVSRESASGYYTAEIFTTPAATFNYDIQNMYSMQLLAIDGGSPASKSGACTLIVDILDVNNRDPRINPLSQFVSVSENTPVDTSVYRILADDPDANNILRFNFSPEKAIDGSGNVANSSTYDFRTMFRINPITGDIIVNSTLKRDSVSRISNFVQVQDIAANPVQTGNGTFLIYILEYNDQAPYFDLPVYNLSIEEEANINSFVINLNCRDDNGKIAGYELTQDVPQRPVYFSLIPGSGAMIVVDRVDFEFIEKIELTAKCTDTGQPQLSNYTKVIVNVININDNTPSFVQPLYRDSIYEGTYSGSLNLTINAIDEDKGDFGVIRYSIPNSSVNFTVNNTTGEIYFVPGSVFDREKNSLVSFQVLANDSPLNATVRRSSIVSVYITILDVNDNCPVFSRSSYKGQVPESAGPNTNVIDLIVTDADEGTNAAYTISIKPGSFNPPDSDSLFSIGNGRIVVANSLRSKAGLYTFNVTATDHALTNPCTTQVPVTVNITRSQNDAPIWIKPPQRDFVINVLESQYDGMLVYAAKAVDNDTGGNGIVDYFFVNNNNQLVSATPEFQINQVTGVIRAECVFDREQVDSYFLTLMAKDRGSPSASSETTLTVIILDVNDNDPTFLTKDGVVVPLVLPSSGDALGENIDVSGPGYYLGSCNASDADSDTANNKIFYKILSDQANVLDYIRVNITTCGIYLIKKPDFETMPVINFDIYAYNDKNDDRVVRNKREVDPRILPVVIRIKDSNDNPPVFTQNQYYECVRDDAPFNENILEVSTTDKDTQSTILYMISGTNAFVIEPNLGIIANNISFQNSAQPSYSFKVIATDGVFNTTADVMIIVVSTSNLVNMKINRPLTSLEPFRQQIARSIQSSDPSRIKYACITDMKTHVENDGTLNSQATDVYVAALSPTTGQAYSSSDLVALISNDKNQANSVYNAIYVTNVKADTPKDEFSLQEDAVLAILIITILLIFLAIILFIIAWLQKEKTKYYQSSTHMFVPQPVDISSNPVFKDISAEDPDMYTLPKKKHISPQPSALAFENLARDSVMYTPPPEPVRHYLNEPEPVIENDLEPIQMYEPDPEVVIETELEPIHTHFSHLPPPQPFEPEFEDKIITEIIDDDLPAPYDEIETVIRDTSSESSGSPASSRRSVVHDSD